MKFFMFNNNVESQLKKIRMDIRLSMNGKVSAVMENAGLKYKKNYGLYLPDIKAIAKKYDPSEVLAINLWNSGNREEMMLATMLYPREKFTIEMVEKWSKDVKTEEIARQLVFNILIYENYDLVLAKKLIYNKDVGFLRVMGWLLASKIVTKIEEPFEFVKRALNIVPDGGINEVRSISVFLKSFLNLNIQNYLFLKEKIKIFEFSKNDNERYVYEEVITELEYGKMKG